MSFLKSLFKSWQSQAVQPAKTPEILGLKLHGAFELDPLKLKVLEPQLIIKGAASTQLIQAVGVVRLDTSTTLLRYYTDDEGFIQVALEGGMEEQHITDVKLWYFYETRGVSSQSDWDRLLAYEISQDTTRLEGFTFNRVWHDIGKQSPPVAMTETTYTEQNDITETDQFMMLYERQVDDTLFEYVTLAGEEKVGDSQPDHSYVICTGFDLKPADISIIG